VYRNIEWELLKRRADSNIVENFNHITPRAIVDTTYHTFKKMHSLNVYLEAFIY